MRAKPKKCITTALKGGKPCNPNVKVWESDGKWFPQSLDKDHFKHLGKDLLADLSEKRGKEKALTKLNEYVDIVDRCLLTGVSKVWIWANFVVQKLSWIFLIQDFPPTFVKTELEPIERRALKKWSGLAKRGDPSIFFRSHGHFGLSIPELCVTHKKQRIVRRHQLANSADPRVKAIHEEFARNQRRLENKGNGDWKRNQKQGTNEWKECCQLDTLVAEVKMDKIKGRSQTNQAGLGYGVRYATKKGLKREREQVLQVFSKIAEEERILRALTKRTCFSNWLKWDSALAVDLSWQHILHRYSDSHFKFVLNSIENTLPTPDNLKRWGQSNACGGRCPLGCNQSGTLMHILCGCEIAHREKPQNRIAWRHDSILFASYHAVTDRIKKANEANPQSFNEVKTFQNPLAAIGFKSDQGNTFKVPGPKVKVEVLAQACDWQVQFDLDMESGSSKTSHKGWHLPFPPEIAVVSGRGSRPDGVIWSTSTKTVIWIELTSPWTENMQTRHFEKKAKYNQLAMDLRNPKCDGGAWTVYPLEVEVSALGQINEQPWMSMCKRLDFSSATQKQLTHAVAEAPLKCSHMIYLCRYCKVWEPQPLLDTYKWYSGTTNSE